MALTTQQIADALGGELVGPGDRAILSVEAIDHAGPGQITFITEPKYAQRWQGSRADAAIVLHKLDLDAVNGRSLVRVVNVDLALATLLELLAPPAVMPEPGVHPTAVVDPSARLAPGVRIGPHCFVGPHTRLGEGVIFHANVSVLAHSEVGPDTVLWPGVVVRERCIVGSRCILHPNAVIGADGFGFRPTADGKGLVKVPQIGNVVIGDEVEIGAGSCVDRAKFGSTTIGDMTKIDNLCHIAHNCRIGRGVVIAANCGIAGSTTVGDGVMMGGCVCVKDHVTLGAGAKLMACAAVMSDIPPGETWGGYPAKDAKIALREVIAVKQLPELLKRLKGR